MTEQQKIFRLKHIEAKLTELLGEVKEAIRIMEGPAPVPVRAPRKGQGLSEEHRQAYILKRHAQIKVVNNL